jgi:uncharacterized protein YqgV (UPF0045/DUF77 family)
MIDIGDRRVRLTAQLLEGDWTEVMNVISRAHALIHDAGVQKVYTDVRIVTRQAPLLLFLGADIKT